LMDSRPPLLRASAIFKSFSGAHALKGVSFDVRAGEVHALIGENGAGKSTLIRILAGAIAPDSGTLEMNGRTIGTIDPLTAKSLGIAAIYQQPALFPDLTVAENIALGVERGGLWRRVDWRSRRRRATDLLARVGADIDPDACAGNLSVAQRQMFEIARVLGADAKILILDEPTPALTHLEVEHLFTVIRSLREQGVALIYISHRLEELFQIADRVTVLRDGVSVGTADISEVDRESLIRMMVGRDLSNVFPKRQVPLGEVTLEVRDVGSHAAGIRDINFIIRSGEILGLAGLVGSGRTQLAETLFGLTPADSGHILLKGEEVVIDSPRRAIELGIGHVPEDRRRHGLIMEMPVAANTTLADLKAVSNHGLLDFARERAMANDLVRRLGVKTASIDDSVDLLSGGNQQKVSLCRWLGTSPSVLLLDEPTQGVDVGAKSEIHSVLCDLAERGMAILMISSELPEILGMSDRIAIMRAGTIVGILDRTEATQENILALALGDVA
jgi:rhamnose transport system ATP-binding protein